jgi:hypothetical protein
MITNYYIQPPKNMEHGQKLTTGHTYSASQITPKRWLLISSRKNFANQNHFFAVQRRSARLLFCRNETYQFAPGVSLRITLQSSERFHFEINS